jgi:hypothetical protein
MILYNKRFNFQTRDKNPQYASEVSECSSDWEPTDYADDPNLMSLEDVHIVVGRNWVRIYQRAR